MTVMGMHIDTWRGQKRVWQTHPSGNPNLSIVIELNDDDVRLRKYQAATIEMATKGESGKVFDEGGAWATTVLASEPGRAILEIDPGLGKSRIGIEIYKFLRPKRTKVLVVCSKKSLNTWRREFPKWHAGITENDVQIVEGSPTQRQALWNDKSKTVYVVTYQSGMKDEEYIDKHKFDFAICDECKLFINRKTKAYEFWARKLKPNKMPCTILMEGTLVKTGPQDLWGCLHIIKPQVYSSYWKFVNAFCIVIEAGFGKMIAGPKNTDGLAQTLRPRYVRLKEKDPEIAAQRPPLLRDAIDVDIDPQVRKVYHDLCEEMLAITPEGNIIVSPSQMGVIMKLRQLLACPAIFDPSLGLGVAFNDFLERLEEDEHPVLFTPFRKAVPYFIDGIKSAGWPEPYVLVGGTESMEIKRVEDGFNSPAGQKRACIVTTKFAESFELYTAKRCFHIGYEWSQLTNYQAEKRLHRLITPHPVNSWYYRHRNTVDEAILYRLDVKQGNVNITFQDFVNAIRKQ